MTASAVAVVLAGRGHNDALSTGVAKALLELDGKPMGLYVIEALRASASIDGIIYVGPTIAEIAALVDHHVPQGKLVSGSVRHGLEAAAEDFPEASRFLVITADLPWLKAEAVDDFLKHAPQAGLVYPIVADEVIEAQFPGQTRTYARLKEGRFTGGNAFLLEPEAVPKLVPLVERFYRLRKNPLATARLAGFGTLLKLALGRLTVAEAEARASHLAGVPVRAYRTPFASLGADIDKKSHLEGLSLSSNSRAS